MILHFRNGNFKEITYDETVKIIELYEDWLDWNIEYDSFENFCTFLREYNYKPNKVINIRKIYHKISKKI